MWKLALYIIQLVMLLINSIFFLYMPHSPFLHFLWKVFGQTSIWKEWGHPCPETEASAETSAEVHTCGSLQTSVWSKGDGTNSIFNASLASVVFYCLSRHHHQCLNVLICTGFPGPQTGFEGCFCNLQGICQRTGGSKQTAFGMCGNRQKWYPGSPKWYS